MPDIAIAVLGFTGNTVGAGQFSLLCHTLENGDPEPKGFDVTLNYADNAALKVAAIQERAVQVWADLGVTIGTSDKKTVFGSPSN